MNVKDISIALQKEAKENPAASDFFKACASRKRDRTTLSIKAITQKLKSLGVKHDPKHYERLMKVLASVGLGNLQVNHKGLPVGLSGIKCPLQSIGLSALGQSKKLESFVKNQWATGATAKGPEGFPVSLTVVVNGKPVNLRVPQNLTKDDIADLVVKFRTDGLEL